MKVDIYLNFLRRFIFNANQAVFYRLIKIDTNARGIAQDLRNLLIQAEHQAALTAQRSLGQVLERHLALADTRDPADHRGAADKISTVQKFIQARDACRDTCIRIEAGSLPIPVRCPRGLHATVDLDALAIDDSKGVAAHLTILPARFHDFNRAADRTLCVLHPEPDHRISDGLLRQRCAEMVPNVGRCFDREHGGEVLALQSLGEHMKRRTCFSRTISTHQPGNAIHKDTPRADLGGFREEHAVGLLQLLPQYVPRGKHDLNEVLPYELVEIPTEQ